MAEPERVDLPPPPPSDSSAAPPANENKNASPAMDQSKEVSLDFLVKDDKKSEDSKEVPLDWVSPTEKKIQGAPTSEVNPANIVTTDPKTGLKTLLNCGAEEAKIAAEKFKKNLLVKQGHLLDVDYEKGTGFTDRMSLSMMDNDAERRAYLSDRYGAQNVQQDPAGTLYVITKSGKKIAPAGAGIMEGAAADILGHGEELALMAQGAKIGSEAGVPGAIIGAMVGGIGGKALQEYEKNAAGYSRKTPEQTVKSYDVAALTAGVGEGIATPFAGGVGRALEGGVPRWISGATPETERLTAQTLRMGGVPPIKSALPEMKVTQFHQALGEKLTGDLREARNLAAVEGEMKNVLKSSGMDPNKIPGAMATVLNTSEAPSYSALGDVVKDHAVKYQERAVKNVETLTSEMNKHLDARFDAIKKLTSAGKAGDPALAQKVANAVSQNRKEFSKDMSELYGQIDNLAGDQPTVPTGPIKKIAKQIYDELPKTASIPAPKVGEDTFHNIAEPRPSGKEGTPIFGDARVLKALSDIQKISDKISFSDAQRIRSTLGELGRMEDLTPGVSKKDFNDLRTAVDQMFDMSTDGQTPQAVALLRKADALYKDGIRKFEDVGINQLVSGMKTGIYPDASKIVSTVFQKGQSQRATEILKMLPDNLRTQVKGEFFSNIMQQAADKTTGQVSGSSLSRAVSGKHDLLEAAFGPKTTKDIELYARQLAMRDEKIPLNALDKDRISESIRAAQKAQESLGKFLDDNYLSELAKPSLAPETVYKHLVQPGKETELARAIQFFGPKSPQVQKLRETALVDLLHKAVIPTESGAGNTIGGDALENVLAKYTAKQKALLFPNGLDKDLETIAENAKFLFPPKGSDMAAGLAAGAIKMAVPFGAITGHGGSALTAYGYGALWNYLLSRPQTIKYLALGLNSEGPAKEVALSTIRGIVRAGALGMLPDVDEK